MKKKVIFAVATGLFALATVFNMNVLQSNNAGDVSLESIAVMAQANDESGSDCSSWGHKTWNVWYSSSDGVDCACKDREDVGSGC
ncbi:MAG TPA: hypothetical protein VLZ83_05725 [Edaphocola sp.]|nr:hypothetical protein [Edaphocola sp.]